MNNRHIIILLIIITAISSIILITEINYIPSPISITTTSNEYFSVDGQYKRLDAYNIAVPIHYTSNKTFYMFWQPVINGTPGPRYKAVPPLGDYNNGDTFPISITGDPDLMFYDKINLYASSDPDGRFAVQTYEIRTV